MFRGWWQERPKRLADHKVATGDRAKEHPHVRNAGAFAWRGVRRAGRRSSSAAGSTVATRALTAESHAGMKETKLYVVKNE